MLSVKNIYKSYGTKDNKYPVLKDINLNFRKNEFVNYSYFKYKF